MAEFTENKRLYGQMYPDQEITFALACKRDPAEMKRVMQCMTNRERSPRTVSLDEAKRCSKGLMHSILAVVRREARGHNSSSYYNIKYAGCIWHFLSIFIRTFYTVCRVGGHNLGGI